MRPKYLKVLGEEEPLEPTASDDLSFKKAMKKARKEAIAEVDRIEKHPYLQLAHQWTAIAHHIGGLRVTYCVRREPESVEWNFTLVREDFVFWELFVNGDKWFLGNMQGEDEKSLKAALLLMYKSLIYQGWCKGKN